MMPRILVVEDEAMLLMLASIALEDYGYEVLTAANGMKGLEVARSQHIDLIVTDFMMPEMDGIAMLDALRSEGNISPAIVTTAIPESQLPQAGDELFNLYISKPYNEDVLAQSIDDMLSLRDGD
ncbi:response regulator [Jiella sp. MQZ9-1]|uniref:Response regulator n=1 Tax=Jiella flava TaxID=2816857 RepID=A0A939FWV4_9HYPH|nr:response regulator [Jiella flava]MBO0663458.1 response regulator [Jiella flava]MCD2472033.1 response regulator [Jiella flava]